MRIHVAIVSDQLLPTVIPALMHRPDRVVLVASQPMRAKAERLEALLKTYRLPVGIRHQAPDAGLDHIREYAAKLAHEVSAGLANGELVFNATGGTKLMTLGFVEIFRERADRIIYTDTAHGRIEVVYDRSTASPRPELMHDVLNVPQYLAVQGFRYEQSVGDDPSQVRRIEERGAIARWLAQQAGRSGGVIRLINAYAHNAMSEDGRELTNPLQQLREPMHGELKTLIEQSAQAGLLTIEGPRTIRLCLLESARFLGGGWLEEYAFAVARGAGLFDVRMGVRGVWEGAELARNEFDVLACHRNRLLFIECKTGRFGDGENDNELAYKVKSLGEAARGLLGDTWVLAAQEPTPVLRDRAQQAGFQLIGPQHLNKLPRLIEWWKQGRPQAIRG